MTTFKAPQKTLKTSWKDIVFAKHKKGILIVRKSLSPRHTALVTYHGEVKYSSTNDSY